MIKKYDTLYQVDSNENTRVWWMEQNGDKYRAVSGVSGGKMVTSEWKLAKPKNIGKVNATTGEEQAAAEINSQYTKKRDRKYHDSIDAAAGGSNIIEPMLADKYKGWDKNWTKVWVQPKLDGMRCIATSKGLFSRQGKPIVSVPHIIRELAPMFEANPSLILDGELYNHDLRDDFNELISLARQSKPTTDDFIKAEASIQYHVYDMVHELDFSSRFNYINETLVELGSPHIKLVATVLVSNLNHLDEIYGAYLQEGYEGQMVRLDTPYEQKRTKALMKRKEFLDDEFEVIEILEGQGNWSGYAKSVQCKTKQGIVFNAGIKGNQAFTKELLTRSPVPKTVTVRYQNITPDGSLRFPIAVAFYEGERDV